MPEVRPSAIPARRGPSSRRMRVLHCPLDAEILVAEFADELPPDVAIAVREHVTECDVCGPQARELRTPYELLGSLGAEPVPYVPDLRERISERTLTTPLVRRQRRIMASVGAGSVVVLVSALILILIGGFVAQVFSNAARPTVVGRAANTLVGVPVAGGSGLLLAQTDTLVPIIDRLGATWNVSETLVASKTTGQIVRTLPASSGAPRIAQAADLPLAIEVSSDGATLFELTAPGPTGKQALLAFDTIQGALLFAAPLTFPGGTPLPGGMRATALALSPNAPLAYIGLSGSQRSPTGPRALVVDEQTGALVQTLAPDTQGVVPLAQTPVSPTVAGAFVPQLDVSGMRATQGLNGALAISADGLWLFDTLALDSAQGPRYQVVRRFSATTGATQQEMALPGDFAQGALAASKSVASRQVYLFRGSPDAELYILDASPQGPTLLNALPLGGPGAITGARFTGSATMSAFGAGSLLYISQNTTTSDHQSAGHDLWLVDCASGALLARRSDLISLEGVLANANTDINTPAFVLRRGQVMLVAPDLTGEFSPWLSLQTDHHVLRLLATIAGS